MRRPRTRRQPRPRFGDGPFSVPSALADGAAFSHVTALRLLGVDVPWPMNDDERLHVTTRNAEDRPQRPGVVGHRTRQPFLEVTDLGGLPVTTPRQTWTHVAVDLLPDEAVVLGRSHVCIREQTPPWRPGPGC